MKSVLWGGKVMEKWKWGVKI